MTEFNALLTEFSLSDYQLEQLHSYARMLKAENEKFNITAITDEADIYKLHFYDSLSASKYIDFTTIKSFADVGCGGGFPGIPLKIMFPHLRLYAIEVNLKKAAFLETVAQALGLQDVYVYTYDWRTFLRQVHEPIDIFVARASLQVDELLKLFKPSSFYKLSSLYYWASEQWVPSQSEKNYIQASYEYLVARRKRKLVRFTLQG